MYGLDLFSGIGGITKALDGYVFPIAYCEKDLYAQAVLLSRMFDKQLPTAPIWDDVQTLSAEMLPKPIDIIYGGFPCQDISVAGRGEGLGGKRSGLFFEIVRLIREIKPSFVFLENVPNIRTKGLGRVLKELADCGYDCRWGVISAADVGANHKRERWFLLAHSHSDRSGSWGTECAGQFGRSSSVSTGSSMADSGRKSSSQENTSTSPVGEGGNTWPNDSRSDGEPLPRNDWWVSEPAVGRVAYGVPKRVDRLRALGNAVVPSQAREAFERLMGMK